MKNNPKYCKFCRRVTFTSEEEKCTECKVSKNPVKNEKEDPNEQIDKLLHYIKEGREWLEAFEILLEKSKNLDPKKKVG